MTDLSNISNTQKECCEFYEADFFPPDDEQLVVISDGVYESDSVEGVRYQSPGHMSGWWVTTDRDNGDTDSLKTVHFSHIKEKRPSIAVYMALPSGYRFIIGSAEDMVWLDEAVAEETP